MPSEKGKFITVEGVEGVGKSTNLVFIARCLQEQGKTVLVTREPGGTPIAEAIRHLLLNQSTEELTKESELLLLFAARNQHVQHVILPALDRGEWVVCDRFTDATYAYQGAGRGISPKTIHSLEQFIYGNFKPDLTILLDLPVEEGMARITRRGGFDRIETEELGFFKKVRDCYLTRSTQDSRFKLVFANDPLDKVQKEIRKALRALLPTLS